MPIYIKSVSFYNRAVLIGEFDSPADDAVVNEALDGLRRNGAEVKDIKTVSSGGFFKYVQTYVITYEADRPLR